MPRGCPQSPEPGFAGAGRSVLMAGREWSNNSISLGRSDSDLTKDVLDHAPPAIMTHRPEPAKPRSRYRGQAWPTPALKSRCRRQAWPTGCLAKVPPPVYHHISAGAMGKVFW
eukprot:gene10578-biopygen15346